MKIITDSKKQLNLNPQIIYFMLTPQMCAAHAMQIEKMNRQKKYSRTIFRFRTITIGQEYYHNLSDKLVESMKGNNLIVRLVNDSAGTYYYAMTQLDLDGDPDIFDLELRTFVTQVCRKNIVNLESRLAKYVQGDQREKSIMVAGVKQVFEEALHTTPVERPKRETNDNRLYYFKSEQSSYPQRTRPRHHEEPRITNRMDAGPTMLSFMSASLMNDRNIVEEALQSTAQRNAFKRLMEKLEKVMDTPNPEESDEVAQGSVNNDVAEAITLDQAARFKSKTDAGTNIRIAKVVTSIRKDGSKKKAWGIEVINKDEITPIYFSSKDSAILYFATLLCQKMGTRLYRHTFTRPNARKKGGMDKADILALFDFIYRNKTQDFDTWFAKLREDSGHAISQGKSACNRMTKNLLKQRESVLHNCRLDAKEDENGYTYYEIDIPRENIILPEEMNELFGLTELH